MAERVFNTTGPVFPAKHFSIPPLERLDLDEILRLIRGERYFVLHAPRQTGKTSALLALRDLLNEGAPTVACTRTSRPGRRRGATSPPGCGPCWRSSPNAPSSPWATASSTKRGSGRWTAPVRYMDRCRAGSGHLVVFDRAGSKPWDEKPYRRGESLGGRPVTVWGV